MAWDYGYGDKGNRLITLLKTYPPDLRRAKELIDDGIDINSESTKDNGENMLSEIFLGYPWSAAEEAACDSCTTMDCDNCPRPAVPDDMDGRYLPEIIKLFLNSGFDVTRDGGRVGGRCLLNLTWASYDKYILDATKLLLHAGVDPNVKPDDGGPIKSWALTKASLAEALDEDHECANLFRTMYEIMDAASKGEDYDSVELNEEDCVK